jgi:hypothetical protein
MAWVWTMAERYPFAMRMCGITTLKLVHPASTDFRIGTLTTIPMVDGGAA